MLDKEYWWSRVDLCSPLVAGNRPGAEHSCRRSLSPPDTQTLYCVFSQTLCFSLKHSYCGICGVPVLYGLYKWQYGAQASLPPTLVRSSVRRSFHNTFVFPFCQGLWDPTKRWDDILVANIVADMVAHMEVDMVACMEVDKVADMVTNMVADKKKKKKKVAIDIDNACMYKFLQDSTRFFRFL